jgi:hypothetical protein
MKTIAKPLLIFFAAFLLGTPVFGQWSIKSISSTKMEKQTSKVSTDFWLHITIKNDSKETLYIWGQRGFHIVEAFIKNSETQVWERQNMGICGTMGEPSWQPVKAGQEVKLLRRESVGDIGKSMMLTFQASIRPDGMRINSDVLLGAFEIPKIEADKAEQGGADQPATAHESKSEGKDKPKPESEVRPQ